MFSNALFVCLHGSRFGVHMLLQKQSNSFCKATFTWCLTAFRKHFKSVVSHPNGMPMLDDCLDSGRLHQYSESAWKSRFKKCNLIFGYSLEINEDLLIRSPYWSFGNCQQSSRSKFRLCFLYYFATSKFSFYKCHMLLLDGVFLFSSAQSH